VTGGKTSLRQLSGSFRRIALVVNPTAGIGFTRLGPILKDLIEAIHPALVTTDPFVRKDGTIDLDELSKRRHSSSSRSLTQRILQTSNPDLFLVFGGNGTARDVLEEIRRSGRRIPILSIGAGTTNLSPTISLSAAQAYELDLLLDLRPVDAVEFAAAGEKPQLAFIDILFSNGVVGGDGTGRPRLLSASEYSAGRRVECEVASVGTKRSAVTAVRADGAQDRIASGESICQVVVGPVWRDCSCFALAGGMSKLSLLGIPAAALVALTPVIIPAAPYSAVVEFEPFHTKLCSLPYGSEVRVAGLSDDCWVSADGSPLMRLNADAAVSCRPLEAAGLVYSVGV